MNGLSYEFICMECGLPAQVEVAGEGCPRLLCWVCAGVAHDGSNGYWLPGKYPCRFCGAVATLQVTSGDGITRPMCEGCAGVQEYTIEGEE